MSRIKTILVPVDFSPVALKALEYGTGLGRVFGADILLVTVIEDRPAVVPAPHPSTPEKQRAVGSIQTRLDELSAEACSGVTCNCRVGLGDVEGWLLDTVHDVPIDLIVMGTHGRGRLGRWLLGSVTQRILRKTPVGVVTLSGVDADAIGLPAEGHLLYATDLSVASRQGLEFAYDFARSLGARLTVLNVVPPWSGIMSGISEHDHRRFLERQRRDLERSIPAEIRRDEDVRSELREGIPYLTILERAEEDDADLIVVTLHGAHGLERAVLGSTADRVIRGADRPVLSLPMKLPPSPN